MGDHKPTDLDLNGGRPSVMGVHLISEAERLAYADRDKYVADTEFVPLPGGHAGHPAQQRLPRRARGADLRAADDGHRQTRRVRASRPSPVPPTPEHGTSQISVVDSATATPHR